jgi:hypothetical protein
LPSNEISSPPFQIVLPEVLFPAALVSGRELGDRAPGSGLRRLATGVRVNLGIEHQDVHVLTRRKDVIETAVADVVGPAIPADDPHAAPDQSKGRSTSTQALTRRCNPPRRASWDQAPSTAGYFPRTAKMFARSQPVTSAGIAPASGSRQTARSGTDHAIDLAKARPLHPQTQLAVTEGQMLRIDARTKSAKPRIETAFRSTPVVRAHKNGLWAYIRGGSVLSLVTTPIIYSLIVPFAALDVWTTVYQWVCFPAYGIACVPRRSYFALDRHRLEYLNAIEKMNCTFCTYANGVIAYVGEVAARTEQYWCPIKHGRAIAAPHTRYSVFVGYGDATAYTERLPLLRTALRAAGGGPWVARRQASLPLHRDESVRAGGRS